MDGVQLSQGNRATTMRVYILPLAPQEFLVLMELQHLNHWDNWEDLS